MSMCSYCIHAPSSTKVFCMLFWLSLQPLQVVLLEPARVLSTWKTRSWLWILFFFPSRRATCMLRKKQFAWTQWVNSPNENFAEKELAGIFFTDPHHQGTKSYQSYWITDSENADSLYLTVFFSYCIGCRIKISIRWLLGESWEALIDHLTKPSVTAFFSESVFLQVLRKILFELKKTDIVQNLSPVFVKNIFSSFIEK